MGTITLAARALLALVFGTAGLTKLFSQSASRTTFREFGAPESLSRLGALLLPPAELAVAIALMIVPTTRWGAIGAVALLLLFLTGIINALRQGRRPDCGCFGGLRPTPIGRSTLIRNAALVVVAIYVLFSAPGPAIDTWVDRRSEGELALLVAVLLAAGAACLRTYLSTAGAKHTHTQTGQPAFELSGPRSGDLAPPFNLTGVSGEQHTLASLCSSGRPVVLVFGSSGCSSCVSLFSHLGRWQASLAERLQIAIVGTDDAARLICLQNGLEAAFVDIDGSVWRAYGILTSPAAFAIATDGTVRNGPAVGRDAIEDLVRLTVHWDEPAPDTWKRTIHAA